MPSKLQVKYNIWTSDTAETEEVDSAEGEACVFLP